MCLHTVILSPLQLLSILLMEKFVQGQAPQHRVQVPACLTGPSPSQHGHCWPGHTPPTALRVLPPHERSLHSLRAPAPQTYFLLPGWARGPALAWAAHQPLCYPVCLNLSLERGLFLSLPFSGYFLSHRYPLVFKKNISGCAGSY